MNNLSSVEENISSISFNTKWNDKLEQVAKEIGENAKGYKSMHLSEAQKYSRIYNRLTIIGIILGPLSGMISSIETMLNPKEPNLYIIIPGILFSFLSGIIVAIIKFGNYDEQSIANKQAAARYTSLEYSVRRQLVLYRNDRMPANSYLDWLETKYQELFSSAPLLPSIAYEHYSHIAKKLGLSMPNQYTSTIVINRENNDETDISVNVTELNNIVDKIEFNKQPNKIQIRRGNTMNNLPELNQYSDKMLEYEMRRFNN